MQCGLVIHSALRGIKFKVVKFYNRYNYLLYINKISLVTKLYALNTVLYKPSYLCCITTMTYSKEHFKVHYCSQINSLNNVTIFSSCVPIFSNMDGRNDISQ